MGSLVVSFVLMFIDGIQKYFFGAVFDTGGRHVAETLVKLGRDAIIDLFRKAGETREAAFLRACDAWAWWVSDNTNTMLFKKSRQ